MLRLTLRSGHDGRLLARIVDRDGVAFVLDYGDPATVADASRKVLHGGFRVGWGGTIETAAPGSGNLLRLLALHYAEQGLLVSVDEPDFPRREGMDPLEVPPTRTEGPPTLLPDEWTDSTGDDTEILSRRDLQRFRARLEQERVRENPWKPPKLEPVKLPPPPAEDEEEDKPTEELDVTVIIPRRPRRT